MFVLDGAQMSPCEGAIFRGKRRPISYTRMWANAQRDGRPAEHRWCPLFNAAVWLTPTTIDAVQ